MSTLKNLYQTDVRPVLLKNRVGRNVRTAMFEVIKHRNAGIDLTDKERQIDMLMLKMGIDTIRFIPVALRRNWQEQPD